MRYVFLILGILLCLTALDARAANPRLNCTTVCRFITDVYSGPLPAPTSCELYSSGAFKATAPVEAVTGGVRCNVPASFSTGSYSLTAKWLFVSGDRSPDSAPFLFDSAVPIPAPTNLRVVP